MGGYIVLESLSILISRTYVCLFDIDLFAFVSVILKINRGQ